MLDFTVNATHLKSPKVVFGLAAEKLDFNTLFPPLPAKPAPAKVANDSAAPAETAPATAKSPPAAQSASATPSLSFLVSVDMTGKVDIGASSEERCSGEWCVSTCRYREGPYK